MEVKLDDSALRAALARLRAAAGDARPAFREIGECLIEATRRRFAEGRGPDGPATLADPRGAVRRRCTPAARRGSGIGPKGSHAPKAILARRRQGEMPVGQRRAAAGAVPGRWRAPRGVGPRVARVVRGFGVPERKACAALRRHRPAHRKVPRGTEEEVAPAADRVGASQGCGYRGRRRNAAWLREAAGR
ncbi:MAG: phage virion morphogenesis protein [Acetobacteraceae bacterium]|nr:phage virion morphogenesis protein [Acetobacteraceae bacterium]